MHLGGKSISQIADSLKGPNTIIHDVVTDAREFMRTYRIMAVPIHSGSGTRIKILEGMAEGSVIASTTKGVDGMGLKHNREVMIADDPEHFAGNIVELLENVSKQEELVKNSFDFLARHHSSAAVAGLLDEWKISLTNQMASV